MKGIFSSLIDAQRLIFTDRAVGISALILVLVGGGLSAFGAPDELIVAAIMLGCLTIAMEIKLKR